MRLPNSAHTSRPWRIHELTTDFELEDVWKLPTPGGRDELARLVQQTASISGGPEYPAAFRALFALRKAYMAAIKPFRYALVYPMRLRSIARQWQQPAAR